MNVGYKKTEETLPSLYFVSVISFYDCSFNPAQIFFFNLIIFVLRLSKIVGV